MEFAEFKSDTIMATLCLNVPAVLIYDTYIPPGTSEGGPDADFASHRAAGEQLSEIAAGRADDLGGHGMPHTMMTSPNG
jgi:hypothetical protein